MSLRRFYASGYHSNFPSRVRLSLILAESSLLSSSLLHAAMNLRPPSVTYSIHTPASNAVAFQSLAVPNARMSLRRNRSTLFPFDPVLSALHPQAFQTRFALATACRSFRQDSLPTKISSCATLSQCSHTPLSRGHARFIRWPGCLCFRPVDAKQDPDVYGAEFGAVFLARGSMYRIHTVAPRVEVRSFQISLTTTTTITSNTTNHWSL